MALEDLKEKLSESEYEEVQAVIADRDKFKSQVKQARDEAVESRHKLKESKTVTDDLLTKLGIESVDDIDNLPDAKGQADKVVQLESSLKRLQKDIKTQDEEYLSLSEKHRSSLMQVAMKKALSGHEFIDDDVIESFARQHASFNDNGEIIFKSSDGDHLTLAEGVNLIAKKRPGLLKAQGSGGSGNNPAARGGGSVKNPFAKDTHNLTEQIAMKQENPQLAEQMKAAAHAA